MTTPNYLFLDLETTPSGKEPKEVSLPEPPTKNDVKIGNRKGEVAESYREEQLPTLITKWVEDCEKIKKEAEDELRKEALDPLKGKILCLGYAFDDQAPEIISGSEKEIISIFTSKLQNFGEKHLTIQPVGHNIKNFDMEWLMHRAIKYKRPILYRYLKNCVVLDTSELFVFNKYGRKYYSLDSLLKYYEIGGKPEGIDGSKVFDYWVDGRLEEIYNYCASDVIQTRELFKVFKMMTS